MSKLIIYDNLEVTRDIPKNFWKKILNCLNMNILEK